MHGRQSPITITRQFVVRQHLQDLAVTHSLVLFFLPHQIEIFIGDCAVAVVDKTIFRRRYSLTANGNAATRQSFILGSRRADIQIDYPAAIGTLRVSTSAPIIIGRQRHEIFRVVSGIDASISYQTAQFVF